MSSRKVIPADLQMSSKPWPAFPVAVVALTADPVAAAAFVVVGEAVVSAADGQGAPFPVNELAGTPYFWSNAIHCSGDSLMSITFIVTPVVVWLRSMPEQAVRTVLKKAVRVAHGEHGGRLFSARESERRCGCSDQ